MGFDQASVQLMAAPQPLTWMPCGTHLGYTDTHTVRQASLVSYVNLALLHPFETRQLHLRVRPKACHA